ncbi:MAG: hypothetical protein LBH20_06830 [Treponema sp.]|jgi:hypothetical protein|nr:hypothetical protein [Treponema sp.]
MTNNKQKLFLLFIACYLLSAVSLSAGGKKDSDEQNTLNNEWILCVTAFDYSLLPSAKHITGDVITRSLVNKLDAVSYRFRISPEYAYYENYAWQQAVSTAAKAFSNKQNERSQLLFRGDPDWKYRSNLKKIDADLVKLEETYAQKVAEKPLINEEPLFSLSQSNLNGTYPAPPKAGGERRFCQSQKSDAFLTGQIREFHNRYYVKLSLFILYTDSWVYEDDVIFSLEDIDGAVNEIAARLDATLAGNKPASVAVTVDPPESQILLNRNYAGTGTAEKRERPPGNIIIAVAADGFVPESVETELTAGEHVDIAVTLAPMQYADVNVNVRGNDGAAVYHGALYVGAAPLTLRLPIDQLDYVNVKARNGETAKAVFTSPPMPGGVTTLSLKTRVPPPLGQKRVNKARSWYYWAWGGAWMTVIAAWISDGMFSTYNNALAQSDDPALFESAQRLSYVRSGAIIGLGAALTYAFFQMGRYLYTASDDVTPIIKTERQ